MSNRLEAPIRSAGSKRARAWSLATAVLMVVAADLTPARAWLRSFDTGGRGLQYATAVAIDPSSDVIVAGATRRVSGFSSTRWFTVCKLSGGDGATVWCLPDVGGLADAVVLDPGGDVFASGAVSPNGIIGGVFGVLRIDGRSGAPIWQSELTEGVEGGGHARAIALSGRDVFATGSATGQDPISRKQVGGFVVARFAASDGTELSRHILVRVRARPPRSGEGRSVAVDGHGSALVAGFASPDSRRVQQNVAVAKVGDSGIDWQAALEGTKPRIAHGSTAAPTIRFFTSAFPLQFQEALPLDEPTLLQLGDAVAAGPGNTPYVAGYVHNVNTGRDLLVARLAASDGHELWRRTLDGGPGGSDRAFAMVVDRVGDPIVSGYLDAPGVAGDFAVVKFDAATGTTEWTARLRGTLRDKAIAVNRAFAVAIDPAGDVVAAGVTTNIRSLRDWTILKLAGSDGRVRWCRRLDGGLDRRFTDDLALTVAVDGMGDVVAAGSLAGRFAVLKLSGTAGESFSSEPSPSTLSSCE